MGKTLRWVIPGSRLLLTHRAAIWLERLPSRAMGLRSAHVPYEDDWDPRRHAPPSSWILAPDSFSRTGSHSSFNRLPFTTLTCTFSFPIPRICNSPVTSFRLAISGRAATKRSRSF